MASLFGWASSLVSSTASAVKDAVVSTIGPESSNTVVPQLSSKRPLNKKIIAGGKKKKAPKKKKNPTAKARAADEDDDDSVANDGPELSDADVPTAAELPHTDDKRDTSEDAPIAGATSEEADNIPGGNDDSQNEAGSDADDNESGCEGEGVETAQLTAAELIKKERNRRKSQKAKEKARLKKALLASSVVRTLPDDALEPERASALQELSAKLKEIKPLTAEDVRVRYDEAQKELDEFLINLEVVSKTMDKKTPRPENRNMTSQQLKAQIQDIEFSPDRDESAFVKKVDQLQIVISNENHRVWQAKVQTLRDRVDTMRKAHEHLLEQAREQETRERILGRLSALKDTSESNAEAANSGNLDCVQYDLQPEQQSALFQPYNLLRRIERRFQVVLETAPRSPNEVPRRGNQGSRFVNIWGGEADVEKAVKFLNEADLSARQRRQYDRRYMGAIIGRSGVGLSQLEELGKAFVYIDGTQDVVVFGSPEGAKQIFEHIEKSKSEVTEAQASTELYIEPIIARAISGLHRAVVQSLESTLKCRVIVIANPSDGSEPRLIIRGRTDQLEAAKKKVKEEIADSYVALTFLAPPRAVNRLLVPPRNVSETSQSRLLHEEFRLLRETLALFVDRFGTRPGATDTEQAQEESDSGMTVVCHKVDKDVVQARVADLVDRASYATTRVPIEREQLRKFTPENRALIEATSKCQCSVSSSQAGAYLNLLGSEEAIDSAKKVVAEILQREGRLETVEIDEPEVLNLLLRDRAARLRALEAEHNVSVSVYRDTRSCKIVGDEVAIANCGAAIREMCDERKNRRAQTETLSMEIESRRVAQLIGRGGATINDIRNTSEVDSIQIPNRDGNADPDAPVTITITGLHKNVEIAQKMVERILSIRAPGSGAPAGSDHSPDASSPPTDPYDPVESNPYVGRGRGRGRGMRRGGNTAHTAPPQNPRSLQPTASNYDENFPSLPGRGPAAASLQAAPEIAVHRPAKQTDLEDGPIGPALPLPVREGQASEGLEEEDDEDIAQEEDEDEV
eukprot:Gregarina_sp_Pseudo_9__2397@NODE_269_length_3344_cov_8_566717_g252_i0_p1_GENE_NODE_269_length_3344_cov_8_566717_g252_i0NODE_269_length_3344_cov_8_566717_g252_i0_p1_ORF_typecomplete_len1028_score284_45KH_1/PF00013_29/40KH_1/PF00013_29/0_0013KH_1/PF00013_29/0_033KH_1/PF00013_29/4_1e02KH_1/PF00013_29/1_4KH_1/PF00013_29/3_4e10SLS/PF14611_6/8_2e02SLS/PF14611_6/0_084SLS/PF14611_6/61SLS/PF14611_6/7_9e06SLS/PF14611_6/1_3e02KH_4/PF13083_6/38KH_4/PF13083_6/0_032KH_2/PF07650_17/7_8e02KH_2/PF07650_17/52KH_2